jgi:cell division protease FtsH
LKFGQESGEVFLGRDMGHQRDYSEEVAARIDEEVRRLIEAAHDEAFEVLVEYRDVLDNLVLQLMEKETLSKEEVLQVFAPVKKRPSRGSWTGTGKRRPSDKPPVTTPAELSMVPAGSDGHGANGQSGNGAPNGHGAPNLQKQPQGGAGAEGQPPVAGPSGQQPSGQSNWPPPSPASGGYRPGGGGPEGNG